MGKSKKENKEENKDNKKKFRKLKIASFISLSLIVILLTGVYLVFFFTHKDSNRNTHVDNKTISSEIIKNDLIKGFDSTKESGKYSFRLNQDDLNQIILNSTEGLLWDNALNFYADEGSEHFQYFHIDLKKTLGVETRVTFALVEQPSEVPLQRVFKMSNKVMGKLPYINEHVNVDNFVTEFSSRSSLPISYSKEDDTFILRPTELINYFPESSYKDIILELTSLKPECISFDPFSLFGFDIDLSLFNSTSIPPKKISSNVVDIPSRITSSIDASFLSSLEIGEEKKACSVSIEEVNKIISDKLHFSESLICVDDIYLSLKDSTIVEVITSLSFNGYHLYFKNVGDITPIDNSVLIEFYFLDKTSINGIELDNTTHLSTLINACIKNQLNEVSLNYDYLNFFEGSYMLSIDFRYITNTIHHFNMYDKHIVPNLEEPIGFDIMVKNPD